MIVEALAAAEYEDSNDTDVSWADDDMQIKNLLQRAPYPELQNLKSQEKLREYWKSGSLSDIKLQVQNKVFKAHRVVLAMGSPYFEAMFQPDFCEASVDCIKLAGVTEPGFHGFLQFLYDPESLRLHVTTVCAVLQSADKFQCENLRQECAKFMLLNASKSTCLTFLIHLSNMENADEWQFHLEYIVDNYLSKNFKELCQRQEFLELPWSVLKLLWNTTGFNLRHAYLGDVMERWMSHDVNRRRHRADIDKMLQAGSTTTQRSSAGAKASTSQSARASTSQGAKESACEGVKTSTSQGAKASTSQAAKASSNQSPRASTSQGARASVSANSKVNKGQRSSASHGHLLTSGPEQSNFNAEVSASQSSPCHRASTSQGNLPQAAMRRGHIHQAFVAVGGDCEGWCTLHGVNSNTLAFTMDGPANTSEQAKGVEYWQLTPGPRVKGAKGVVKGSLLYVIG